MDIWREGIQWGAQKCKLISGYQETLELTISRAVQIEAAYKACPKTQLVVSGYSQGGQLVHNAIGLLPATVAAWSKSTLIFSHPVCGLWKMPIDILIIDSYEIKC